MKINMDKVKVASFAISKRLLGYKILKNPKGTSPYELTMVKSWFGFHEIYHDKFNHIKRWHIKKNNDKLVKDYKMLLTTYYMDPETKEYSGKRKEVMLNGKFKNTLEQGELDNRPEPNWKDLPKADGFGRIHLYAGEEEYVHSNKLWDIKHKEPKPLRFWRTLISNLRGGE